MTGVTEQTKFEWVYVIGEGRLVCCETCADECAEDPSDRSTFTAQNRREYRDLYARAVTCEVCGAR